MVGPRKPRKRHVLVLSDSTGRTGEMLVRAALAQFQGTEVDLEVIPRVQDRHRLLPIMRRASILEGVVVYTMVSPELRRAVMEEGMNHGVPTVDVMGPLLTRLSDLLEISPLARPGLFRQLDEEYFRRIESIDFAVKHDDGAGLDTLDKAEIVLVGVSRSSKTPLSIYLSYRGWKVANVPFVPGIPLPPQLDEIDQRRVVALVVNPAALQAIRKERERNLGKSLEGYTDLALIREEMRQARRVFEEKGWPLLDVTQKSIEESATEIMKIIYARTHPGEEKGGEEPSED